MNILILSWRGLGHPNVGGAEIVTHEHAKAWNRAGFNVTIFTSSFAGAKKKEEIDGVKYIRSGSQVFRVQIDAFFWYLFKKRMQFDLVIDQFHGIPFFTPLYVGTKKLGFIHEVAKKDVWKLNPWPKPFNLIPYVLGTYLEPLIFKILYTNIPFMTVSKSTKDDLINFGIKEKNITIIENGASILEPGPKIKKETKKTAIYLGALSPDKGVEKSIEVFAEIDSLDKDWQFWIVGNGSPDYVNHLKKRISKLNLQDKVKFWGFVSQTKKFELLKRAHIFVDLSVREGWGLVVIEAAAMGTPTVAFNVAGLRDSIVDGKTGILCQDNLKEVAKNTIDLVNDKKRYEDFEKNCVEWSKNFTWEKSTKRSLELIEKLTSSDS